MRSRPSLPSRTRQAGIAAVELALVTIVLFTILFGIIELSRLLFLLGTYAQATGSVVRGAAMVNITADKDALRRRALMVTGDDPMVLSGGTTYQYLHIDYLNGNGEAVSVLPCAAANLVTCTNNPDDPSCIRFVRARLCQPDSEGCANVPYEPMLPLGGIGLLKFNLPWFTAIAPVESLGMPNACS
jgi:hypothetical protein